MSGENRGRKLAIRADASTTMGTGHVMRCLGIAQSWMDEGGEVTFIVSELPGPLKKRLVEEGIHVRWITGCQPGSNEDARATVSNLRAQDIEVVIVDGYQFYGGYQQILKEADKRVLIIDDFGHSDYYYADIILNKGLLAHQIQYKNISKNAKLLLGPAYTTFRREFLQQSKYRIFPDLPKKVLVTFGGSDPANVTQRIIEWLDEFHSLPHVVIVTGAAYLHKVELQLFIGGLKGSYEIQSNVQDMAALMAECDFAITAGGTTLYELAYMGLPSMTIQIVDNQKSAKYFAERYQTTAYLGHEKELRKDIFLKTLKEFFTKEHRMAMSQYGMKLVDGKGNERVIKEIINLYP